MESETSGIAYPVDGQIAIDLFVSKKHPGVPRGHLAFLDYSNNLIFRINPHSPKPSASNNYKKVLLDASGEPLLSIYRYHTGSWKCYKGESNNDEDLVFRVQRSLKKLNRVELEVFLTGEILEDTTCDLKVRGSPFQRSCSIYNGNSLLAQTSLMYKLDQIFVSRKKFRLTIFPGSFDHALLAALVVIFLNGRK
ncbi:protein LURP-one-related 7 [Prosopis cineraria]|uniref:protein LURP-one-related 7 n=1 Tax=Prosopis cineraria TaxID=364024 RepID=UPI0024108257|nr:protein LURP-one-related 7 [Prosopis cineraria]